MKANRRDHDDAMFLRREIIDAIRRSDEKMETYLKKEDEEMDKFDENEELLEENK